MTNEVFKASTKWKGDEAEREQLILKEREGVFFRETPA